MSTLHHRSLLGYQGDDFVLLDAVAEEESSTQRYFFKSGTDPRIVAKVTIPIQTLSIGGGLRVTAEARPIGAVPHNAEHELLAGLDTIVAQRNGEDFDTVRQWLVYHANVHGAEAAIILDRAPPNSNESLRNAFADQTIDGLKTLVIVDSPVPLGASDLPPESHPFNAPDAPGKDRMEIPAADPWRAPLGEILIYEIFKSRFLGAARSVVTLDCTEFLAPIPDGSVFDSVRSSDNGALALVGTRVYPWRIRKGQTAQFGDHICRQFDQNTPNRRWALDVERVQEDTVWRLVRVVGAEAVQSERFYRCVALRYKMDAVNELVPKSSLIEDKELVTIASEHFAHKPVRMPEKRMIKRSNTNTTAIVTTMKNEGPFILEWVAFHKSIGVDDILVYTNDCDDGTDDLLNLLQERGIVQRRDNPFRETDLKPQHAALQAAENEPVIQNADWVVCMDVDEFISIHVGEGKLSDLFAAVPDANMISMTWRLFGNSDIHEFSDTSVTEQFTSCAPEFIFKPHQAWGFKTLCRQTGIFKKLGVHRPKGLHPQLMSEINWVNGSGKPLPSSMYRNSWRSTAATYGYELVTLNHYAVRSAESFLVKRDRGRVNHVDRDQGLAYWFRMNNNAEQSEQINRSLPAAKRDFERMMSDPEIQAAHEYCVSRHREKIAKLRATERYARFYDQITSDRMQRMSKMHTHFDANVFLSGPDVVPDEIVEQDHPADFLFRVEKGETAH
ncbi:glycosyltransferase family 2 protein [Falsihalocynthiibacter sp. SS001]|uniref:glycosyltransferase family 2 protein n=1 Tax=Falsihalocynthiibacter sp. SS001 TaxID=3349698 RepID=UPI0036D3FF50